MNRIRAKVLRSVKQWLILEAPPGSAPEPWPDGTRVFGGLLIGTAVSGVLWFLIITAVREALR